MLSKKQLQASEAAKAAADVEKAAQDSLAALDKEAAELQEKYDKHIVQIQTAKIKAKEKKVQQYKLRMRHWQTCEQQDMV